MKPDNPITTLETHYGYSTNPETAVSITYVRIDPADILQIIYTPPDDCAEQGELPY